MIRLPECRPCRKWQHSGGMSWAWCRLDLALALLWTGLVKAEKLLDPWHEQDNPCDERCSRSRREQGVDGHPASFASSEQPEEEERESCRDPDKAGEITKRRFAHEPRLPKCQVSVYLSGRLQQKILQPGCYRHQYLPELAPPQQNNKPTGVLLGLARRSTMQMGRPRALFPHREHRHLSHPRAGS